MFIFPKARSGFGAGGKIIKAFYFPNAVAFCLLAFRFAPADMPVKDTATTTRHLAVLDLVDLNDNQVTVEPSEWLRHSIAAAGKFKVLPRDTMIKKLGDFNVPANQPCNTEQCGFDAGNYLQADFVLYGTCSPIPQSQSLAVTLKLLYVPKTLIVWTWVGEIQGGTAPANMASVDQQFMDIADTMKSAKLTLEKPINRRTLAVIDLSDLSFASRVFSERVQTRIDGYPQYDPLGQAEISDLLSALGINKYAVVPSLDNMIGLGQKLGVSELIYSRIYRDGKNYLCRLAMYDVEHKAVVLETPPESSEDFNKLLDFEHDFFVKAIAKDKISAPAPVAKVAPTGSSHKALWISLGLLGLGGGAAVLWVENLKKTPASNTVQFPAPLSPPSDPNQ